MLDLGDLSRQGEQIRGRAKADAEALLTSAAAERKRLIADGREHGLATGHAEGFAKGMEEGRAQGEAAAATERRAALDALMVGWTQALEAFERGRDTMLLEARQDVLRLAVMMGERITRKMASIDPTVITAQMESVLTQLFKPTRVTIRINAEDEPVAIAAIPAFLQRFRGAQHVEIVPDATLPRGACIAETAGGGVIDASIATQLDRMVAALMPEAPAVDEPPTPGNLPMEGQP